MAEAKTESQIMAEEKAKAENERKRKAAEETPNAPPARPVRGLTYSL